MKLSLFIFVSIMGGVASAAEPLTAYLSTHCKSCHGAEKPKGEFRISDLKWPVTTLTEAERWKSAADRIGAGEMPPKSDKHPAPPAKDTQAALEAIHEELTRAAAAIRGPSTGAFRRLNRLQYQNTMVDLLGIRADVSANLTEDAVAHDFDRIGAALTTSGEHLSLYMAAAEQALYEALPSSTDEPKSETRTGKLDSTRFSPTKKAREERKDLIVHPEGGLILYADKLEFPDIKPKISGRYKVRITHAAYQTTGVTYSELNFGDGLARYVESAPGQPKTIEVEAWLAADHNISIQPLLNNPKRPFRQTWSDYTGAGVHVKSVEIEGPLPGTTVSMKGYQALFGDLPFKKGGDRRPMFWTLKPFAKLPKPIEPISKDAAVDAEKLLKAFLPKAFRRPAKDDEVKHFAKIALDFQANRKASFMDAMVFTYIAVLCSPDFLFFQEKPGPLNDYAIASRLSYFLIASMPDEELLNAAKAGTLRKPEERAKQANRLLDSPMGNRFVKDFTDQWLELNQITTTTPDEKLYPEFDRTLLKSSVAETQEFFRIILKEDRSLTEFVQSDWAMLNSRLAKLYDVPGVNGMELRRVQLPPNSPRGGVLTQASVLKVTANGTITSPVKRGKWILERIVGRPPAPPPPNVPMIEPDVRGATTIRDQFAKHRSNESCAGCHAKLDPHGFALESFDVIGTFRDRYRAMNKTGAKPNVPLVEYRQGPKVDAADQLNGVPFQNVVEYKKLLLTQKEQIARSLTEKMMTYALGRELTFADHNAVEAIVDDVKKHNYGFRTLILDVVRSDAMATQAK